MNNKQAFILFKKMRSTIKDILQCEGSPIAAIAFQPHVIITWLQDEADKIGDHLFFEAFSHRGFSVFNFTIKNDWSRSYADNNYQLCFTIKERTVLMKKSVYAFIVFYTKLIIEVENILNRLTDEIEKQDALEPYCNKELKK